MRLRVRPLHIRYARPKLLAKVRLSPTMRKLATLAILTALFAGCTELPDTTEPNSLDFNGDGIVVIAVVDDRFNAYHFDFRADQMPQHLDQDTSNDLPLDRDPAEWLPGHPGGDAFASYTKLELTLDNMPSTLSTNLYDDDKNGWGGVGQSNSETVRMAWLPGTKVVGLVNFASNDGFSPNSHGAGSASVSVGNIYGACPECLLVMVNGMGETSNEWVAQQDWIDAQTNSWGLSTLMRDRMYAGSDTDLQKEAVTRGQQIFFSAGNGQANAFVAPNPTLFSSQEGPDWIITVGAISPADGSSYSGHGKPADIASIGSQYPAGNRDGVDGEGTFGGTSNATPVTAGMYGHALYELRVRLNDARRQSEGVIAQGQAGCQNTNPDCPLADGILTVREFRDAFLQGAEHTPAGWNVGGEQDTGAATPAEATFMAEGHGSNFGRFLGDDNYRNETRRVVDLVTGGVAWEKNPEENAWFVADSYCRQMVWGTWDGGYFGADTVLPSPDPAWPMRTWLLEQCPTVVGSIVAIEKMRDQP